jgi:hypothetical protein
LHELEERRIPKLINGVPPTHKPRTTTMSQATKESLFLSNKCPAESRNPNLDVFTELRALDQEVKEELDEISARADTSPGLLGGKVSTGYWVIYEKDRPTALIKTRGGNAMVVAGDSGMEAAFKKGQPDTNGFPSLVFEFITNAASHPCIGEWIDKLGRPARASSIRLEKQRKRMRAREASSALSEGELAEIVQLHRQGCSQRWLADKYGVNRSFIRRLTGSL